MVPHFVSSDLANLFAHVIMWCLLSRSQTLSQNIELFYMFLMIGSCEICSKEQHNHFSLAQKVFTVLLPNVHVILAMVDATIFCMWHIVNNCWCQQMLMSPNRLDNFVCGLGMCSKVLKILHPFWCASSRVGCNFQEFFGSLVESAINVGFSATVGDALILLLIHRA